MGCSCAGERPRDHDSPPLLEIINKHTSEYSLLAYTLSTCEKSKQLKEFLRKEGVEFEYFDIDKLDEGKKILHALEKYTAYKSAPFVFHKKVYIGGLQECQHMLRSTH